MSHLFPTWPPERPMLIGGSRQGEAGEADRLTISLERCAPGAGGCVSRRAKQFRVPDNVDTCSSLSFYEELLLNFWLAMK